MGSALASLSLLALYALIILRFSRDFRRIGEPRLRRLASRVVGSRIDLLPPSAERFTDREWIAQSADGTADAKAAWLSILVTAFVVFVPAIGLFLAAHFHFVPWRTAGVLLGPSLMVGCLCWLLPSKKRG
jgi:hypothetical protein